MRKINGKELKEIIDSKEKVVIIDLREKEDYDKGHVPGAYNLALGEVSHEIEDLAEKDEAVCVYCYSGNRSGKACAILDFLDYSEIYNLGSINNWEYAMEE